MAENLFPFGNPNLRPETSKGWEFGADQTLFDGDLVFGATYFRNDIDNLILFDLATFTLQNIGAARTHGMEFTTFCNLTPSLFANASYTVMDTLDEDTQQPLVRRPRHKGTLAMTRRLMSDRASISIYGVFVGDRTDARDGSVVLDPYSVFHLSGDYYLTDGIRLIGRIHNLLDERYEEITGFAAAPLSGYAGVNFHY